MTKRYSIADARKHLPSLVNAAAAGSEVHLTRRGEPVAVMLSVREYERLTFKRRTFAEAFREFRKRFPEGAAGTRPDYFRRLRDRSEGRKVKL